MNVATVIAGCSQDIRRILDSSNTTDQVALIDYTNRIQLQLLRAARWRFLLSGVLQFETSAGASDYWIGATGLAPKTSYSLASATPSLLGNQNTDYAGGGFSGLAAGYEVLVTGFTNAVNNGVFSVVTATQTVVTLANPNGIAETNPAGLLTIQIPDTGLNITNLGIIKPGTVFDRSNGRRLYPTDEAPIGTAFSNAGFSGTYRNDSNSSGIFSMYPPPQKSGWLFEFRYFYSKPQLKGLNDNLLIPDDYIDVVIAGVNYFANLYLRENPNDAMMWKGIFEEGIAGMKRDYNLFPRGQEFIAPDPATQPRDQIIPIGLDSGIETSIP